MWYFDTNPIGRILNRFTYDVEQVDIVLSQFSELSPLLCSCKVFYHTNPSSSSLPCSEYLHYSMQLASCRSNSYDSSCGES